MDSQSVSVSKSARRLLAYVYTNEKFYSHYLDIRVYDAERTTLVNLDDIARRLLAAEKNEFCCRISERCGCRMVSSGIACGNKFIFTDLPPTLNCRLSSEVKSNILGKQPLFHTTSVRKERLNVGSVLLTGADSLNLFRIIQGFISAQNLNDALTVTAETVSRVYGLGIEEALATRNPRFHASLS